MRSRDCIKGLRRLGFRLRRQNGSHAILKREQAPRWTVVVPMHEELSPGTLRSILEQAHVRFQDLLDAIES